MTLPIPRLDRREQSDGVVIHTDQSLYDRSRIQVAFSERTGGVSRSSWRSLNLATHVGDDAAHVAANRARFLSAARIDPEVVDLVVAEQVHGDSIAIIDRGALCCRASGYADPFIAAASDALLTHERHVPLLMLYADCVPIILVAEGPIPSVCVVHAGWRGIMSSLPERAAVELINRAGCSPQGISAYIGAHIGSCCFRVAEELSSAFAAKFGQSVVAGPNIDLHAAVEISLLRAGLLVGRIASLQICTAHNTDRFFSYRSEGTTGRHGALASIE
ncbi:MAG: polyphenol oxidase family protein [Actinobacteria bacterium]|nr:polyphenol oxidase family protein [Actinomycetota bacterium]MCL5887288.1 polyphenol oxidase family protein [Actinomycetota bacterium]